MAGTELNASTDSPEVAKIFAAMHLAQLATTYFANTGSEERAKAYAGSFKTLYNAITEATAGA